MFSKGEIIELDLETECFIPDNVCSFPLNENSQMTVSMPVQVSSTKAFDINVDFKGVDVVSASVFFKVIYHSHGLRKIPMTEMNPQSFNVRGKLGYCGSGVMKWIATFDVISGDNIYKISHY